MEINLKFKMEAWLDIQPIRIPRPKLVPSNRPSQTHQTNQTPITSHHHGQVSSRYNGDLNGPNNNSNNQLGHNQIGNQGNNSLRRSPN